MNNFWKSARRWLPGVVISIIAIVAIVFLVDWKRFVEAIRTANYWLLLAFVVLATIWLAVRSIVWRTLLRNRASYKNVFLTLGEGYLLNNFLPFRLGEVGMAFLLARKSKLGFMDVFSTVVIERVVDLAFSAAFLLVSVPFVVGASGAARIAAIIGVLVVAGLVFLYVAARNREWAMNLFNRLTGRWPIVQKIGDEFISPLFSGLAILTDGKLFIRFLLWMTFNWAIGVAQFYILVLAFFPNAQPVWALFGLGAVAFGNAIPSMPGAIGTFEAALVWALTLVSHDQSAALALAVTDHLIGYFVSGVIGLIGLSSEGETLMGVYRQVRKRQEKPESSE